MGIIIWNYMVNGPSSFLTIKPVSNFMGLINLCHISCPRPMLRYKRNDELNTIMHMHIFFMKTFVIFSIPIEVMSATAGKRGKMYLVTLAGIAINMHNG